METLEQYVKSVLVSLLLTLNRFHTLFWCFQCWIWKSKCRLVTQFDFGISFKFQYSYGGLRIQVTEPLLLPYFGRSHCQSHFCVQVVNEQMSGCISQVIYQSGNCNKQRAVSFSDQFLRKNIRIAWYLHCDNVLLHYAKFIISIK